MSDKRDVMTISGIYRKLIFIYYALKPFRPAMVVNQLYSRILSLFISDSGFRVIDLSIGYKCNLKCDHCSATGLEHDAAPLTLDDYRKIVRDADGLGNLSWNITGGEPLMVEWLEALIHILNPSKNYISLQTNCMLLTRKRAVELKKAGVNCITTSLDSHDPDTHNRFRGNPKSYDNVISGIRHAKDAGMQVLVGGTVTHDNIQSSDLQLLIEKVNSLGAIFLFNLAVPCGSWRNNRDIIITDKDRQYLKKLLNKYPATSTDHEPGRNSIGCPAGMEKIYITPDGDVLPCPFIHVSFGNIKDSPLSAIVKKMRCVPQFGSYPDICVAAEDSYFHDQVFPAIEMYQKGTGAVPCEDVFKSIYTGEKDA